MYLLPLSCISALGLSLPSCLISVLCAPFPKCILIAYTYSISYILYSVEYCMDPIYLARYSMRGMGAHTRLMLWPGNVSLSTAPLDTLKHLDFTPAYLSPVSRVQLSYGAWSSQAY